MPLHLQIEFFKLAAIWLACRRDALNEPDGDLLWRFLGECDYRAEMEILTMGLIETKNKKAEII